MYHLLINPLDAQEVEEAKKETQKLYIMGLYSKKDVEESLTSIQEQVDLYHTFESKQQ